MESDIGRRSALAADERGLTLIEILAVTTLAALLLTLSAGALRQYWLVQSLYGGRAEVQSQLRQLQSQVTSESHPLVYGARFPISPAGGSDTFGLVRYDPNGGGTGVGTCRQIATATLASGVFNAGALVKFPDTSYSITNLSGFGFTPTAETVFCRTPGNLKNAAGTAPVTSPAVTSCSGAVTVVCGDQYVWFYARGTASPGRVQIVLPALPGRSLAVTVSGITARVDRS